MTSIDTLIKRINSRLDTVKNTLGKDSRLYHDYQAAILSAFPGKSNDKYLKREKGTTQIRRTKESIANLSRDKLQGILDFFNRNKLSDEKKSLRDLLRAYGHKGRVNVGDYQRAAEIAHDLSYTYQEALDFFYNWRNEPEAIEGINIATAPGERTWQDLMRVKELYEQLEKRVAGGGVQPSPAVPSFWQ